MNSNQPKKGLLDSYHLQIGLPFTVRRADCRKTGQYERDGHWNQKQRLKYSIFISYFKQVLECPFKKKAIRIYDMMSDMIVTRNTAQCRNHHQKMQKFRVTIEEIVKSVAEKYDPRVYEQMESKYLVLLKVLLQNKQIYTRKPNPRQRTPQPKPILLSRTISTPPLPTMGHSSPIQVLRSMEMKAKKDLRITTDSYLEQQGHAEQQCSDSVPVINLSNSKLVDESSVILEKPVHEHVFVALNYTYPNPSPQLLERMSFPLQGKEYYEQQLKILQMKREWHIRCVQQLNAQLIKEKQAINNCDFSINLYDLALRNSL